MTVLAAVNGRRAPDDIVTTGLDLATALDETLCVLHVMTEEEFESRRENSDDYDAEDATADAANIARTVVEKTVSDPTERNVRWRGRVGTVTTHVLDEAAERDASYLVVGGRKQSPTGKAVFGNTTQAILLDADRPVVTVLRD